MQLQEADPKCGIDSSLSSNAYSSLRQEPNGLRRDISYLENVKESTVMQLSGEQMIKASLHSHQLLRVNDEDLKSVGHDQVVDMGDGAGRWEGEVFHNEPFGWGALYDRENRLVYEGFRIGDANVCYGTRFFPATQKVEYKGGWCDGKRWGRGVQYDRNGNVVYDGEWVSDVHLEKQVMIANDHPLLHNHIEELVISSHLCNGEEWAVLDLSLMTGLKTLLVGDDCFNNTSVVTLVGMAALQSVCIGKKCFDARDDVHSYWDRCFYLMDCPCVREIAFGDHSFWYYDVCEIVKNPLLEVIEFGKAHDDYGVFSHSSLTLKSVAVMQL